MSTDAKAADAQRIEALAQSVWSKLLAFAVQYLPAILEWLNRVLPKPPEADGDHVDYPTSFPLECVTEASQILLGGMGSVQARLAEFGQHVWNVQGYLQGVILGLPDPSPFAAAPPVSEQLKALEELLKNLEAVHVENVEGSFGDAAVNYDAIIALLIQFIKMFLERFKPAT